MSAGGARLAPRTPRPRAMKAGFSKALLAVERGLAVPGLDAAAGGKQDRAACGRVPLHRAPRARLCVLPAQKLSFGIGVIETTDGGGDTQFWQTNRATFGVRERANSAPRLTRLIVVHDPHEPNQTLSRNRFSNRRHRSRRIDLLAAGKSVRYTPAQSPTRERFALL